MTAADTAGVITGMIELLDAVRSDLRTARAGVTTWRSYQIHSRSGTTEGTLVEILGGAALARWLVDDVPRLELYEGLDVFSRAHPWQLLTLLDRGDSILLRRRLFDPERNPDGLTAIEMQIAQRVGRGMSNKEIAREMRRSVTTIKNRLTKMYDKLDVQDRTQLALRAAEMSLIPGYGPDVMTDPEAA